MIRTAAFCLVTGAALAVMPATAQFNNSPPRPPANVPNGAFPPQPPPVQYPGQAQPAPSQQQSPAKPTPVARPPAAIQARPLPPPPGAATSPAPAQRIAPAAPPQPPPPTQGAVNAPGPANPAPQQGAVNVPGPANPPPASDNTLQSDDTVVTETPTQHIENGRAVFSGLDKITGRIISFDEAIGETVQFGALQVTARACYTRPPTEATNTDAFVEVDEVTLQGEIKRIFTGWMFASSPGLHAVEHPIYDVWLTNCTSPAGGSVAQSTVAPTPAAAVAPPPPAAGRQRQAAPARQPGAAPRAPIAAPEPAPAEAPATDD